MTRGNRQLIGMLATAMLLGLAGPCLAQAIVQSQVVGNTRVSFSIVPVASADLEGPQRHRGIEQWYGAHRIGVRLIDTRTVRPLADTAVAVNFAERGYAGDEQRLDRIDAGGQMSYGTVVDLPRRRATYRVRVHFREDGAAPMREAEFEYGHHH